MRSEISFKSGPLAYQTEGSCSKLKPKILGNFTIFRSIQCSILGTLHVQDFLILRSLVHSYYSDSMAKTLI